MKILKRDLFISLENYCIFVKLLCNRPSKLQRNFYNVTKFYIFRELFLNMFAFLNDSWSFLSSRLGLHKAKILVDSCRNSICLTMLHSSAKYKWCTAKKWKFRTKCTSVYFSWLFILKFHKVNFKRLIKYDWKHFKIASHLKQTLYILTSCPL